MASDKLRSRKMVEDRHLEAIRHSDFLWVVCPDGYTGASTSGDVLAAAVLKVPVFSVDIALDITIGDYVEKVGSMAEAIARSARAQRAMPSMIANALLDPEALSETAAHVEELRYFLTAERGDGKFDAENRFGLVRHEVAKRFGLRANH